MIIKNKGKQFSVPKNFIIDIFRRLSDDNIAFIILLVADRQQHQVFRKEISKNWTFINVHN